MVKSDAIEGGKDAWLEQPTTITEKGKKRNPGTLLQALGTFYSFPFSQFAVYPYGFGVVD